MKVVALVSTTRRRQHVDVIRNGGQVLVLVLNDIGAIVPRLLYYGYLKG